MAGAAGLGWPTRWEDFASAPFTADSAQHVSVYGCGLTCARVALRWAARGPILRSHSESTAAESAYRAVGHDRGRASGTADRFRPPRRVGRGRSRCGRARSAPATRKRRRRPSRPSTTAAGGTSGSSPTCIPAFYGDEPMAVRNLGPVHVKAEASGIHEVLRASRRDHDGGWADLDDEQTRAGDGGAAAPPGRPRPHARTSATRRPS